MQSDPHLYPARRIYQVFTLLGVLVTLLFVWTLMQSFDWLTFVFLGLAAIFAIVNLRWTLTRVELTPSGITLYEPLNQATHVDFRQMVAVYEAGRMFPGVSLVYYPVGQDGLLDMEDPRTLFLPAMERQDELLAVLHHEIPE
ncbi:MAG: hypothetical protein R2873_34010 [Caldilineaceae bacterium]|nr:hypothetical protein [Caldilineaceae bacterium]